MHRQMCESDELFPGGYRVRSWTETSGALQCDVASGGPASVQVVEVSCTRIRYGRTIQIKSTVATPPPHHRAAFAATPVPSLHWTWREPLRAAPVEARSPQIVHLCSGPQNIGVEVEVTELLQAPRRVDDGTIEITVTLR